MSMTSEKAAAALELLPAELREVAVAYLVEQAEKFQTLKSLVDEGLDDVRAGRVADWDFAEFLREARSLRSK